MGVEGKRETGVLELERRSGVQTSAWTSGASAGRLYRSRTCTELRKWYAVITYSPQPAA